MVPPSSAGSTRGKFSSSYEPMQTARRMHRCSSTKLVEFGRCRREGGGNGGLNLGVELFWRRCGW